MQPEEQNMRKTQQFINYNTIIAQKQQADYYRPRKTAYSTEKEDLIVPLKKFQQFFGKVKPSLYQQLKNIFTHAQIEQRSLSSAIDQPNYHIQGTMMTSRAQRIKKRKEGSSDSNNFTIQGITRTSYRKAKLNKLVELNQHLKDETMRSVQASTILRQSGDLVKQLKESFHKTSKYLPANRTFRVSRSHDRQLLTHHLNLHKPKFTATDLHHIIALIHHANIVISPSISYFNVYIEEGNNSELLKTLVRRRTGWRVVEIPAIANFIWTQFYKKNVLAKRLNKREKTQNEDDKNMPSKWLPFRTTHFPKKLSLDVQDQSQPSSNYMSDLRKIIPKCEAEDLAKMRVPNAKSLKEVPITHNVLIHNHFPQNRCISDKKNLLSNLSTYLQNKKLNVFDFVPESYQLSNMDHPTVAQIESSKQQKQHWIIKPGQNSNRGRGIVITHTKTETIQQLTRLLAIQQQPTKKKKIRNVVLQKYITPLLYHNRKFDIRSYMLVTLLRGQIRVYCYEQCYIRTSSKTFEIQSPNRLVHLTNDAVQSISSDYGKFEEGNKVSQLVFAKYIGDDYRRSGRQGDIWIQLKKQMEQRCIDVVQSSYLKLVSKCGQNAQSPQQHFYFQLFGMDFMIDQEYKLWLIEVNTNPAITHDCSKVLNLLIPKMLDNLLTLAVQTIMRPLRLLDTSLNNRFTAVHKISLRDKELG